MRMPIVWGPLSAGLLALVILTSRPWEAAFFLGSPNLWPAVGAIALNAFVLALWGVRSARLLASAGVGLDVGAAIRLSSMAYAVNSVTPGSVGEIARAVAMKQQHAVPYTIGAATILVERFGALFYFSASAGWAWLAVRADLTFALIAAGWLIIAILPGVGRWGPFRPGAVLRAAIRLAGSRGTSSLLDGSIRLDDAIVAILGTPRSLLEFALTTAGLFAMFALQLVLVAATVGAAVDPINAWAALGIAMTAGVLSMLPFGLGATDVVLAGLLVAAGVSAPAAAATALGFRLVSTLPLGLIGAAAYARTSAAIRIPDPVSPGDRMEASRER